MYLHFDHSNVGHTDSRDPGSIGKDYTWISSSWRNKGFESLGNKLEYCNNMGLVERRIVTEVSEFSSTNSLRGWRRFWNREQSVQLHRGLYFTQWSTSIFAQNHFKAYFSTKWGKLLVYRCQRRVLKEQNILQAMSCELIAYRNFCCLFYNFLCL